MMLPGSEVVLGNSAGDMNGDGSRKILLHSTEGTTIEGAIAAYVRNNSWPTMTADLKHRRVCSHLDLLVAARSLRNEAGGVETNRDGTVLVQIEIVGFAAVPSSMGSPADWDWFGREVIGPICWLTGVPPVSTVVWVPYPASYGLEAPQRLSGAAWDDYSGVLGHQHASENLHGDPGAIDINRILVAARGEEDDMTPEECEIAVRKVLNEAIAPGQTSWAGTAVESVTAAQAGVVIGRDIQSRVTRIERLINELPAKVAQAVIEAQPQGSPDAALIQSVVHDELAGLTLATVQES